MASDSSENDMVNVHLQIGGRVVDLTIPAEMEAQVQVAADKLNYDLLESIGTENVSSSEVFEHIVSLALNYLCTGPDVEDLSQENRISRMTQLLNEATTTSIEPSS